MTDAAWIAYDFAVLRLVPHVHRGDFIPVGVVVHARTAEFLGTRLATDLETLRARAPSLDVELLGRYLDCLRAIADGDASAGPVALAPPSERFHWLTAPRSDVLQSSPVHGGLCRDPAVALEELYREYVEGAAIG